MTYQQRPASRAVVPAVRRPSSVRPFGESVGFTMASDPWLEWVSRNPKFKAHERIMAAAQLRMNWWGHAPFMPNELAEWMNDRANGKTISTALGLLKARKQIAPASTRLCIILNSYQYKRQTTEAKRDVCIEPKHVRGDLRHRRWFCTGDWDGYEQRSGEWDDQLRDEADKAGALVLQGFRYDLNESMPRKMIKGKVEDAVA